MSRYPPLPLELVLDVDVGEVEVDRRLETVVAGDLLHGRQADPLLQGRRGERVPQYMRTHFLSKGSSRIHRFRGIAKWQRLERRWQGRTTNFAQASHNGIHLVQVRL